MGFRPIGAWNTGGLVVPPINIQSVANIPIQSAANVPLANYQPSTPYVYPDPPATPTPGTTPTGTENTFFAADPDKYTVPTPFSYGTTTPPPPPPPTDPPPADPNPWTPSPGWTIDADGNISLDEGSAPSRYWQTEDDGEDVFDEQWFLSEAYNNQIFQGNPNYHIEETVDEDDDGNEYRTYSFVRTPTTAAPTTVAPPTVGPPKIAPPTVAPPTVGPPKIAPPTVGPPKIDPPMAPPPAWTPSPGWIKRPDGNIYLDEGSAPSTYFSEDDDGNPSFDKQAFLRDAYNNQMFQGSPDYRIDRVENTYDADGESYTDIHYSFVRAGDYNWNDGGFVQKSGLPYTQGRNAMPNVMGREFPYTPEGMAASQQYSQSLGMRDGGMMGFRPIGMQTGGIATSGMDPEVMAIFKGLVAATQSKSPQKVTAYIEAHRKTLANMVVKLPPDQASFVQDALNSFDPAWPDDPAWPGAEAWAGDPAFAGADEERRAGDPWTEKTIGAAGTPDQHPLLFSRPDSGIEIANGGYITRNMNRGGLMSLRRR